VNGIFRWGAIAAGCVAWGAIAAEARAQPICPRELEPLVEQLLRDYPSYANRVITRSSDGTSTRSVVTAGRPEFDPLPVVAASPETADAIAQVFFTTLERQHVRGTSVSRQSYHWLLLVPSGSGWRLVMAFTRLGDPLLPPIESSDRVVGQAVQTWLRDCREGAVRVPGAGI